MGALSQRCELVTGVPGDWQGNRATAGRGWCRRGFSYVKDSNAAEEVERVAARAGGNSRVPGPPRMVHFL